MNMRRLTRPCSASTKLLSSIPIYLSVLCLIRPARLQLVTLRDMDGPCHAAISAQENRVTTVTPRHCPVAAGGTSVGRLRPAFDSHQLGPASIEAALNGFAVAVVAGPGRQILVIALVAEPHFVA